MEDLFSRLAKTVLIRNKRPKTVLAAFQRTLPYFYQANTEKRYRFLAVDRGGEFYGIFKQTLEKELKIKIYCTTIGPHRYLPTHPKRQRPIDRDRDRDCDIDPSFLPSFLPSFHLPFLLAKWPPWNVS